MLPILCHLGHSTVTLETDSFFFLVDWYEGPVRYPEDKPILCIATHGHSDHFSPALLRQAPQHARFLFSTDIREQIEDDPRIAWMAPDASLTLDGVRFHSFGSTDRGISLWWEVDGLRFFHAGDLNAWIWEEDDEPTQQKERDDFLTEVKKIAAHPIDVACVPADPRLGDAFAEGCRLFMEHCRPRQLLPLHFKDDYSIPRALQATLPDASILQPNAKGDCLPLRK